MNSPKAFQDYYPEELSHCYGCGRRNEHGHQLKSYWDGDESVASFTPHAYHIAIPGYVYGGLIASLIDCHCTGTAAAAYFALSSLVAVMLVFALLWVVFERLNGELAELASLDALTRVLNRNGLQQTLRRHFANRPPTPLTLLLVDLDHFKGVNDRHGHAAGDALIRAVAGCLAQTCRGSDFVARFGGEEFLIGCGTDHPAAADQLAQRICAQVADLRIAFDAGVTLGCTVSVGISATVYSFADWEAASRQADQALYRAKSDGRNRWVRFGDLAAAVAG